MKSLGRNFTENIEKNLMMFSHEIEILSVKLEAESQLKIVIQQ